MLTKLFTRSAQAMTPEAKMMAENNQLSFALGLQLTNIIKDCRDDFDRKWCYIPRELAQKHGITIEEFFEPPYQKGALDALNELIRKAAKHLDDALEYTLLFPRSETRIRLFNLWSLFFAIKTLNKAWNNPDLLTGELKVKISRPDVYKTLVQTLFRVKSDSAIRRHYSHFRSTIP
jgi:farnesyl-diphosphate farnesyltransferase